MAKTFPAGGNPCGLDRGNLLPVLADSQQRAFALTSAASGYAEVIVRHKFCHPSEARLSAGSSTGDAVESFSKLPDDALIGAATMQRLYDVSGNATLYRWERSGFIPLSRKIRGSSQRRWVVGEVRAALRAVAGHLTQEADHVPA